MTADAGNNRSELTSHRLAGNSLLNVGTSVATSILGAAFVPLIIHRFGPEFYGILSVTWMVLANFTFLDFGFSRASARYVAQELSVGRVDAAAVWTWTAVASQVSLGIVGAVIIYSLSPLIINHIHVQQTNRALSLLALRFFAFSIPIDFANRSLTGVMQAGQRFDWVNGLAVVSTLSTYSAYGIGIWNSNSFATVVILLFVFKIINLSAAYVGASKVLTTLSSVANILSARASYRNRAISLIRYGWWVGSAALVAPLLGQLDSWMISAMLGVSLLPFFTVPSGLLWRLGFLPNSLSAPLFPAFSAMEAKTEWRRIENYFIRAHRYLLVVLIAVLACLFIWGRQILTVWVGASFAMRATAPLKLMIPGFLIGLLAPLSGMLLEAVGRPDILVKLYLAELPFNVIIVWFLTKNFGLSGAALSYTVRTVFETVILWFIVYRIVPFPGANFLTRGIFKPMVSLMVFIPPVLIENRHFVSPNINTVIAASSVALYSLYSYYFIFDGEDREFSAKLINRKASGLMVKLGLGPVSAK